MPGIDGPPKVSQAVTVPQPPYPVDGNGDFNNLQLTALVLAAPFILFKFFIPYFTIGFWSYIFFLPVTGVPVTIGYWYLMSRIGSSKREYVAKRLPGKPMDYYFTFKDAALKQKYSNRKINWQVLYDAYFDEKVDFNRGCQFT